MIRNFRFYEYAGIIVPGTVLLTGSALCIPSINAMYFGGEISIGETVLALILIYALGHLVQGIGNIIENIWWKLLGGMPSSWPILPKPKLLNRSQLNTLKRDITEKLRINNGFEMTNLSAEAWYPIFRQIYAVVSKAGASTRADIFNGNYGLNRGISGSLLVVAILVFVQTPENWIVGIFLLIGFGFAIYRMHRFGVHYARETYIQFLQLEINTNNSISQN
jgi:hypothetical protein